MDRNPGSDAGSPHDARAESDAGSCHDARAESDAVPPDDARAELDALRQRITELDAELVRLVGARWRLVLQAGELKARLGLPVMDPAREAAVVRRAAERSRELGVDEELTRDVIWRIIASARQAQEGRTTWGPPDADAPEPP